MNATRFSHHVLAGAVSAALLAGCSAGSQFTPSSSAGAQTTAPHQSSVSHGVSPDSFMVTWYYVDSSGHVHWWYHNIWNVWVHGVTGIDRMGGSSTDTNQLDLATNKNSIAIYSNKKLVNALTGLSGVAAAVTTDPRGDTFAAVNAGGATVEEFAPGATTPTATYTDGNLGSIAGLGADKTGRVYVEGQSLAGGIEVDEMVGSGSFESIAQPGALGATAAGLAVQTSGKTTYVWINDAGNASDPANIARYEFDGKSLVNQGSFDYAGLNGGIAVDVSGKDTTDVYAVNNVASGSQYAVSGVEYAFPSGTIVSQSPAETGSQESHGVWAR